MIYAGFFRRFFAFVLDMLIVSVPSMLIFVPVGAAAALSMGTAAPVEMSAMQAGLIGIIVFSWQVVTLVLMWLYFALWESGAKQSTWGKRMLGIKVIGANGGRISFARASGRFFSKIISYAIVYIGFIMAAFTSRKRALHDMICETYVVKKEVVSGQELPPTKSHPFLLVLVCVLWILFLAGISLLYTALDVTPTQAAAQKAAARLESLSNQNTHLHEPLRMEGTTFYDTQEGYRAVVADPVSGEKFTLFLKTGTQQTCCLTFPFGDCEATGFEEC